MTLTEVTKSIKHYPANEKAITKTITHTHQKNTTIKSHYKNHTPKKTTESIQNPKP